MVLFVLLLIKHTLFHYKLSQILVFINFNDVLDNTNKIIIII